MTATLPRRLSPQTEREIREWLAMPGHHWPTVGILMIEIDALRAELAEAQKCDVEVSGRARPERDYD